MQKWGKHRVNWSSVAVKVRITNISDSPQDLNKCKIKFYIILCAKALAGTCELIQSGNSLKQIVLYIVFKLHSISIFNLIS